MGKKNIKRITDLITLYVTGTISDQELSELYSLISLEELNDLVASIMSEDPIKRHASVSDKLKNRTWRIIKNEVSVSSNTHKRVFTWISSIAAATIILSLFLYYNDNKLENQNTEIAEVRLTLESGEEINIADLDTVINKNGIIINKDPDNRLCVSGSKSDNKQGEKFNLLYVPHLLTYTICLSDGTEVTLNANSSLQFPSNFNNERVVYLEGEAYFKVAHDSLRPFIVKSKDYSTIALGTEFSVNSKSYGERYLSTLISGKIRVEIKNGLHVVLNPGEQACLQGSSLQVKQVETIYYTCWKDGFFMFENESLKTIISQISNWYGYNFIFENNIMADYQLTARIKKYSNINEVIDILRETRNVKFDVRSNTIYIK